MINIKVSGKLLNKKMIIKSEYMNGIASCLFVYFFAKFRAKKKKDIFLNEWYSFKEKDILTCDIT